MSDKKYEVIISDRTMTMLATQVRFLAQVSNNAAVKLRDELISEMKELEYMPESYSWLNNEYLPANKYRKKLVCKRYLLIYQIIDHTVYVDYVVDCRQDYGWLL
ncbi:MAG: type II toxin-antitoxin system RelE/ParE family toxin [Clostridia bacterium]|nr:type II toxin-antitoxin system RelE/ParE family toxin [Clostridia bacterium]